MIDNILYFFVSMICLFNLIWIYFMISEEKMYIKKHNILMMIVSNIFLLFVRNLNIVVLKTISLLIFLIVNVYLIKKTNFVKLVFYATFVWAFAMIYDLIFMFLISFACKNLNIELVGYIGLGIMYISSIALQLIYNIVSRQKFHKLLAQKMYHLFLKVNKYIIAFVVISLALFGANSVSNINEFNKVFLIILICFFTICIIVQMVMLKYNKMINIQTNKLILDNNQFYINLNLDTRIFKHNLIHKLDSVKSLGNEKVNFLVDNIIEECMLLKDSVKELDKLPNGINGFIQRKIYPYKDNIDVLVENELSEDLFDIIKMKHYNKLCEVIGVTLDNALEALKSTSDKVIYINIFKTKENINVIIKNSFDATLDVDSIGKINYTSKGKNHGVGLFSILFNRNIKTKIRIVNNIFETLLVIPIYKNY